MTIKSKMLFILIGDDRTGKTNLQKILIRKICNQGYDKLPTNLKFDITHPEIKRKYQSISFGNRSYQEKLDEYGTVDDYFDKYFKPADICFISSHLIENDIKQMIINGKMRYYNVIGIFWSNSIESNPKANAQISALNWDERHYIENPINPDENIVKKQLDLIASNIVHLLVNRTNIS